MSGQLRTALLVVALLAVGAPVLYWAADVDLVDGDPALLALLLTLTAIVADDHAQRHLGSGRLDDLPVLRLLVVSGLITAFSWNAGWTLLVPSGITLAALPIIHRSGSRLWWACGLVLTVFTAGGQAAVVLDLVPTIVAPAHSHAAAVTLALLGWVAVVIVGRDGAERERSQVALARAEARLRALMDSSTDVLTVCDADFVLTYVSPAVQKATGHRSADLIHKSVLDLVDAEQRDGVRAQLDDLVRRGNDARAGMDVLTVHASLERRWYEWTFHNLLDDHLIQGIVVQARDVSERLQAQRALSHAASHDDLTGLTNRGELLRRMAVSLPQAGPGAGVALLFVDLDKFKAVNDRLGHRAGDDVLVVVARRLVKTLRAHDHVGRLGGDEFGVLLTELRDEDEVSAGVERLVTAVEEPVTLPEGSASVGASIGYAYTVDPHTPLDRLLAQADGSMYATKNARRG